MGKRLWHPSGRCRRGGDRDDRGHVAQWGLRTFHHEDNLGSTVARSNDAGWITEINAYGPLGEGTAPHGANDFGFTGQRFDAESGLYDVRARYYSPALGRFLQPDPAGFVDGLNFYT